MKTELFIKTYNNKVLPDAGCYVSPEYKKFQNAFHLEVKKAAESIGAEVVKKTNGHYFVSGFVKKGEKYVYYSYAPRTKVELDRTGILIRTAEHVRDFTGGANNYVNFCGLARGLEILFSK